MTRVFAISDLHVEYHSNFKWVLDLSISDFQNDVLILAGDICDSMEKLEQVLEAMKMRFRDVAFVPGNHEMWVRTDGIENSETKWNAVKALGGKLEIAQEPIFVDGPAPVWLVPLLSWYRASPDDPDSLFIPKEGENPKRYRWGDDRFCKWTLDSSSVADFFLDVNRPWVERTYDAPVISFSHFLPRRELMFHSTAFSQKYANGNVSIPIHPKDPHPYFNFSRVAGCQQLERQIRKIAPMIHVYGHQHRNRCRTLQDITYVSNCLGNLREQKSRSPESLQPLLIWDQEGPVPCANEG